jgi:hypothetical protein
MNDRKKMTRAEYIERNITAQHADYLERKRLERVAANNRELTAAFCNFVKEIPA